MKDLYQTFLRLNYIKRWEVIWPPKGTGHAINEALCREIGLDQAVISLMKQLPYIKGSLVSMDIEVYKYSRAMVYLEDDEIRGGRDPTFFYFQEPRLDYLLPHEIVLICDHDEGSHIILDIKESKAHTLSPPNQLSCSYPLCVSLSLSNKPGKLDAIRVEPFSDRHPGKDAPTNYVYKPERPDDKYHYRNYYPHHAPTWLADWVAKIKSLDEVVPVRAGAGGSSLHWIDPRYPPRNEVRSFVYFTCPSYPSRTSFA
jgi:hypothetical protein